MNNLPCRLARRFVGTSRILVSMAVLVFTPASLAWAQLPTVKIGTWDESANGTGVKFIALTPSVVSGGVPTLPDDMAGGRFEYGVDTSDIKWANECRCYRYYVVTVRDTTTNTVSRHKFKAVPSGSFSDQRVQVGLTISVASPQPAEGNDEIGLPIASAPGLERTPLVTVTLREPVASVSIGGSSDIQLVIKNPSSHTSALIPSAITVTADNDVLWAQSPTVEGLTFPLPLGPNSSQAIRIKVYPKMSETLPASLVPSPSEKRHTTLRIRIPYTNVQFQQPEGATELEVPVRFRPSILNLGAALVLGTILGSLVIVLARGKRSSANWPRAAGTALGCAIILWFVGVFLVANNSKFMVFNFDLDPWQTLSALLLGIGNGLLGVKAARRLKIIEEEKTS